jgi:hypothetical protein
MNFEGREYDETQHTRLEIMLHMKQHKKKTSRLLDVATILICRYRHTLGCFQVCDFECESLEILLVIVVNLLLGGRFVL